MLGLLSGCVGRGPDLDLRVRPPAAAPTFGPLGPFRAYQVYIWAHGAQGSAASAANGRTLDTQSGPPPIAPRSKIRRCRTPRCDLSFCFFVHRAFSCILAHSGVLTLVGAQIFTLYTSQLFNDLNQNPLIPCRCDVLNLISLIPDLTAEKAIRGAFTKVLSTRMAPSSSHAS